MTHEQAQPPYQTCGHEFKLVMPTLITPYQGVYEEVCAEYLEDPDKFAVSLAHRMETDNPGLMDMLFVEALDFSANEDLTHKWMTIYYEIFARSAKRIGLPPIFVSDKLMIEGFKMKLMQFSNIIDRNGDLEDMKNKSIKEKRERRLRDEALSPELIAFWNSFDNDIESELSQGTTESDIFRSSVGLFSLQELLQKQDDEYAITGAYALK